jgi:hypothetical protein
MTFHDHKQHGFVVMDGSRVVAKARKIVSGGWQLKTYGGCWVDPRARSQGLFPGKFPHLMHVGSAREARLILGGLL